MSPTCHWSSERYRITFRRYLAGSGGVPTIEGDGDLAIETVSFAEGYKWRFSEGEAKYTASIEDPVFRARIESGETSHKNDMLRLRMHVLRTQRADKVEESRVVLEVLEHYPRSTQIALDL